MEEEEMHNSDRGASLSIREVKFIGEWQVWGGEDTTGSH